MTKEKNLLTMNKKKYSLDGLQKNIGYTFTNIELLEEALTHSSYSDINKLNQKAIEKREKVNNT